MSQRFSIEFAAANVAAVLLVAAGFMIPSDDAIFAMFLWRSVALSVAVAVAQWLVLRRYVPWAQWWVHATLLGEFAIASAVTLLMNLGVIAADRTPRSQIIITLAYGLSVALAQFPTLYRRVADAWLWLAAAGFAQFMIAAVSPLVLPAATDVEIDLVLLGSTAIQTAITVPVQTATLAWLLRRTFTGAAVSHSTGHTRLEFVIAWVAVPLAAYKIAQAAELSFFMLGVLPVLFAVVLAGGQLWVLSHIAVDQRHWRRIALASSFAIVIVFGLLGDLSDVLTGTRAGTLGLLGFVACLVTCAALVVKLRPAQPALAAVEPSFDERRL